MNKKILGIISGVIGLSIFGGSMFSLGAFYGKRKSDASYENVMKMTVKTITDHNEKMKKNLDKFIKEQEKRMKEAKKVVEESK